VFVDGDVRVHVDEDQDENVDVDVDVDVDVEVEVDEPSLLPPSPTQKRRDGHDPIAASSANRCSAPRAYWPRSTKSA